MLAETNGSSLPAVRGVRLNRLLRVTSRWLLPVALFGVLIAPSVVLSLPFQVLHVFKVQPPSPIYWITAVAVLVIAIWFISRIGKGIYRGYKHGIIWLEGFLGFLGFAVAIVIVIWILPSGWIPNA
jgi:hypothetical protein